MCIYAWTKRVFQKNYKNIKNMKRAEYIQTRFQKPKKIFFMWAVSVDLLNLKLK